MLSSTQSCQNHYYRDNSCSNSKQDRRKIFYELVITVQQSEKYFVNEVVFYFVIYDDGLVYIDFGDDKMFPR